MDAPALRWELEPLRRQLASLLPEIAVEAVARTDSTNTRLLERVRTQPSPCLLVAEDQTAGRGRQGRVWASAPGASLTFSLALPLAPAASASEGRQLCYTISSEYLRP